MVAALEPAEPSISRHAFSPFGHFARLHRNELLGLFEALFDEGDDADHGLVAVWAWLASVDRWRQFESDWKAILERYGVPYLHMRTQRVFAAHMHRLKMNCFSIS
jgi:hypothetical protein